VNEWEHRGQIAKSQYNNGMLNSNMIQIRNTRLLNLTFYVIVLIMIIIGLIFMPDALTKATTTALCIAFGLVYAFGFRIADTPVRAAVYFTVQIILVSCLMISSSPSDVFNLLFYLLALQAVLILPSRVALAWIIGFFVIDSLSVLWSRGAAGATSVLFYAAAFLLAGVFGYTMRQSEIARRQNEQLLEELRTTQRQLQDLALAEERTRLAREMHDSLGHRLTVTIVQLEGAQRLIPTDPGRATRIIATMRGEIKEALSELRRTVTALRSPVTNNLALDTALATLSQTFQQNTDIPTHFSVTPGFPVLPESYRLAFYRTAQEALTNIQRHARAHNGWLQLSADDHQITLLVEDDGKGMDNQGDNSTGSGLIGLRERAEQLGGEVQLVGRPGGGTQLIFTAPLPKHETDL
jgi:signal transduction histidine kinase